MANNYITTFGIKRIWNYIKANLNISKFYLIEYKLNMFNIILTFLTAIAIQILSAYIISTNFGSTINFTFADFIIIILANNTIWSIFGIFFWSNNLMQNITQGKLNTILTRPINTLPQYYFQSFSAGGIASLILTFIEGTFFIIYLNIELNNILLGFFTLTTIGIALIITMFMLDSFNLISIGLGNQPVMIYNNVAGLAQAYPVQFFSKSKILPILYILSPFLTSGLLLPILTNKIIENLQIQLTILTITIFISYIILHINWHYGLKKYGGFN